MKKDDIIKLEYDAWIVKTDELFDTTNEEMAKKEDIYNDKVPYKPQALIVGAETVAKGLDKSLLDAEIGKDYEIEIPPEEAYGKRDPKLVELHTKREIMRLPEFRKGDSEPQVGMQITMKGKVATITAITAGRIRVDFNNKLAGRTLKYKYKVTSIAEKLDDKITSIIEIHYGTSENFEIKTKNDITEILIPDMCKYDQRWYLVKHRIATDLQNYAGIKTVKMIEEYKKREEGAKDEEKKEEGEEKKPEEGKEDTIKVETKDADDTDSVKMSIEQEVSGTDEEKEEEK
ncbi:MAG: FKBP-type peptidyl-prolyl cis-trans isomerase [Thermoplasmata archaeon]|nr:MAG: FKBP-type peptidyl-prolyl cis-trans isomerase [Thermoplasmata archaeon]